MHRLTIRRFAVALGLCIATVVATTATSVGTAYADVHAQVYISSGNLTFVDKPGVNNINLTVRTAGGDVQFDAQYTISPLFGCHYPVATDTTKVNCAGTITTLFVYAGDGNDLIDVDLVGAYSTLPDAIMGEGGNDRLYGGPSFTDIHGGPGSDELYGRGGNDGLLGDDGVVGAGADKMYGGSGSDDVEYSGYTTGVHISLDGVIGDDGMPGEGDTIGSDVERVYGSRSDDVIIGNSADNNIQGCGGADQIYGLGGNDYIDDGDGSSCGAYGPLVADTIDGGTGVDTATFDRHTAGVVIDLDDSYGDDGTPGEGDSVIGIENVEGSGYNDVITGNAAANVIDGNYGNDWIVGLGGSDSLYGGEGADHLYGGDGADVLDGGAGVDTCDLGADGLIATGC
jgi:Ca2+-binding RTX toxin-like protein